MIMRGIKVGVSAGCLAILLWWTGAARVLVRLQDADMTWIALALLAVTVATCAMASRWQITARAFGVEITYWTALREYYLAQMVNMVLPGGVAGDITRAVRARHAADLARAAQSVMAERLLGQIAILGLLCAGFAVALVLPGGPEWGAIGMAVLGGLAGCAVAALVLSRTQTATGRFMRATLTLAGQPALLLHGAVTAACLIFGFYACARATGTILPPQAWATLVPLVLCAMLIPLSVGGWGWREGAAAALFPVIGAPASAGVATGITYGLVLFAAALPAVAILLAQSLSDTTSSKRKMNLP
ncbi:MAG: lysylphosphatidylglycerol synthase transmembrane domain-containing protein [Pseudomonadota bacterium]